VKYSAMGYAQLYDMRVDPAESYSVAANQPQVLEEMRARFAKAQETFAGLKHKEIPEFFQRMKERQAHSQD